MCKIVIVESDGELREELHVKLSSLFPEHEVVAAPEYRSQAYKELEAAAENLIETFTEVVSSHTTKSFWS